MKNKITMESMERSTRQQQATYALQHDFGLYHQNKLGSFFRLNEKGIENTDAVFSKVAC